MTMNAWAKAIHENAVAHGWWETERTFAEVISLFHSEVSEALEEYRAKRPMLYYPCNAGGVCVYDRGDNNMSCGSMVIDPAKPGVCGAKSHKPEGIAVELVDCVIRILDYIGHESIDIPNTAEAAQAPSIYDKKAAIPEAVANIHLMISQAYASHKFGDTEERNEGLRDIINYISAWLANNNINMEEIMLIKHEYNKTRPYRHGGKAL